MLFNARIGTYAVAQAHSAHFTQTHRPEFCPSPTANMERSMSIATTGPNASEDFVSGFIPAWWYQQSLRVAEHRYFPDLKQAARDAVAAWSDLQADPPPPPPPPPPA